jgi:hypothetical protein
MKSVWLTTAVMTACLGAAQATDLNVSVRGPGAQPLIRIGPGQPVPYVILGELSDASSGGLALFALDLSFTGGPLNPSRTPIAFPMMNFASPLGFTNPAGYGGTPAGGTLLQIGGGQNTIRNTVAPTPTGMVIPDVAQAGSSVTLAAGSLTAPYQVGDFTLSASNVQSNVLLPGQTGLPFWKVEPAGVGAVSSLVVRVQAIRQMNVSPISVTSGQAMNFSISAGPANAGRAFRMLGSMTGTAPGLPVPGGLTLPLADDRYLQYTQHVPNSPILSNSVGVLDSAGRAIVTFHPIPRFVGQTLYHAFYLTDAGAGFVSEPVAVQVVN